MLSYRPMPELASGVAPSATIEAPVAPLERPPLPDFDELYEGYVDFIWRSVRCEETSILHSINSWRRRSGLVSSFFSAQLTSGTT